MGTTNLALPTIATNQASPEVPANTSLNGLDKALNSQLSLAEGDADLTLTAAQFIGAVSFAFTGAITGNHNITVPTANADSNTLRRLFFINNSTTGGFALTVKTASGTGIAIKATDGNVLLYSDGTNVVLVSKLAGTASGTFAAGDDSRIVNAVQLVAAPAHYNSTGIAGTIAVDSSNFYVCYATNSWLRISTAGTFSTSF